MDEEPNRAELLALYRIAFDDRNFQVNLNWDRTKHYFLFNAALFGVAGALLNPSVGAPLGAPAALLGFVVMHSLFGAWSIAKGHTYYERVRGRLVELERRLGVDDAAAMKTTRGMVRDRTGAPPRFLDRLTVTNSAIALQLMIASIATVALVRLLG